MAAWVFDWLHISPFFIGNMYIECVCIYTHREMRVMHLSARQELNCSSICNEDRTNQNVDWIPSKYSTE